MAARRMRPAEPEPVPSTADAAMAAGAAPRRMRPAEIVPSYTSEVALSVFGQSVDWQGGKDRGT